MAKGGKREGAGRPKGSSNRPQLYKFYNPKELKEFIESVKKRALTDPQLAKFVGEQLFGKAPQPLEGSDGKPLLISDNE